MDMMTDHIKEERGLIKNESWVWNLVINIWRYTSGDGEVSLPVWGEGLETRLLKDMLNLGQQQQS